MAEDCAVASRPSCAVLVFAPAFEPAVNAGGTARALTNLVDAVAGTHSVTVIAPDRDLGASTPFAEAEHSPISRAGAIIHYVNMRSLRQYARAFRRARTQHYDIAIVNSIWDVRLALLPSIARRLGVLSIGTLVLMPHGELDGGALQLRAAKKRAALPLVRRLYARCVDVLAATSNRELSDCLAWFPNTPTLLTTNEPDTVPFDPVGPSSSLPTLLFLGRINRKKGLLEALEALVHTSEPFCLDIVGPKEDERYWAQCRKVIAKIPEASTVRYLGAAPRSDVPALLHAHDALINLTAGENFGYTFVEALQAGCSVIASPESPWTETLLDGGGWVVEDRCDAIATAHRLDSILPGIPSHRPSIRAHARRAYDAWASKQPPHAIEVALEWRSGVQAPP